MLLSREVGIKSFVDKTIKNLLKITFDRLLPSPYIAMGICDPEWIVYTQTNFCFII